MANIYGDEKKNGARAQWEKMKDAPMKDKIQYIIQYYGIAIVLTIIGLWMVTSLVKNIIYNSVPNIIAGEFYSYSISETDGYEELRLKICEKMGVEESGYHIDIGGIAYASDNAEQAMTQLQKIMARMSAGDLDFLVGTSDFMTGYMYNGEDQDDPEYPFEDLSTILPAELFEKLDSEGRILYYKAASGDIPFAVSLSNSYISRLLDIPDGIENYASFVVTGKNREAFAAMLEVMLEN